MIVDVADYRRWDALEMGRRMRAGDVTAADLADTARELFSRYGALNAVADVVQPPRGGPRHAGPFAGVPFAVKELLAWPGLPWTMGSRLMAANPAPTASPYAARLRDCGLAVLCSTTSSEFGLVGSTESALRGVTRNPWREGLSAGGSSGGSAALVAAGILPMAHGSDAGGSLRVPASLNGVFGFAPSRGRCLPTGVDGPGLPALIVDHCMSRSVRDSAGLLAATERTGPHAELPPVGLVTSPGVRRLRIGMVERTLLGGDPDPGVRSELARAVVLLDGLGHHVEPVDLAVDGAAVSRGFFLAASATMAAVVDMVTPMLGRPPGPAEFEPFTLELLELAADAGPDEAERAGRDLVAAARAYLRVFDQYDVVLSPTLALLPWEAGHLSPSLPRDLVIRRTGEAVGYTPIHNAAGCPAMSLPLGRHDGVPVGIHVAGPPGAEALLLGLAYELEEAAPWVGRSPDLRWLERV